MQREIKQLTQQQAIALYAGKFYEGLTNREIAEFQLLQDRLCMPFDVFHKAISKELGRPVFTHEFAFRDELIKEFFKEKDMPSFEDIVNLIPQEKRIIIGL